MALATAGRRQALAVGALVVWALLLVGSQVQLLAELAREPGVGGSAAGASLSAAAGAPAAGSAVARGAGADVAGAGVGGGRVLLGAGERGPPAVVSGRPGLGDLVEPLDLGESSRGPGESVWRAPRPAPRLVVAVLNGGNRTQSYFDQLYAQLSLLTTPSHDIFVFADEFNYQASRGDYHQPHFPLDDVWRRMVPNRGEWLGSLTRHQWRVTTMWWSLSATLLREYPDTEHFFITENDALICDLELFQNTFEFARNVTDLRSLGYWDNCGNRGNGDAHKAGAAFGLQLYKKNACSMVATLFPRAMLAKISRAIPPALFRASIEGIHASSATIHLNVKNGRVLIHNGRISTEQSEHKHLLCKDYLPEVKEAAGGADNSTSAGQ